MDLQGTTPRQLTDLLGSLCDLTSGSGDKGTPIMNLNKPLLCQVIVGKFRAE